ncbi:cytidine deaminase family protein [Apilactobacillus ozensis]|uniref:cytidine deaminase family protein n=1 Tax=Apilactobacillus ozensis TaxID=866801 RepID=UPI0032425DC7|nr:cytidine deaminase [Apilactobacillus ozensis]
MYTGSVAACIATADNHLYTGISIDTACSIGFCAERNAIGSMLTDGQNKLTKVLAVKDSQVIMPCGVCRELMMQINPNIKVLTSINPFKTVALNKLMPNYWM